MSSLFLPGLVVFWAALSAWAAHAASHLMAGQRARMVFSLVGLLACLPLPLLDELLAEPAFRELCRTEAGWLTPARPVPGMPVRLVDQPGQPVAGLALPVMRHERAYLDPASGSILGRQRWFEATGGKLARALAHDGPISFAGRCGAEPAQGSQVQARQRSGA